jgi:hypothetical protein
MLVEDFQAFDSWFCIYRDDWEQKVKALLTDQVVQECGNEGLFKQLLCLLISTLVFDNSSKSRWTKQLKEQASDAPHLLFELPQVLAVLDFICHREPSLGVAINVKSLDLSQVSEL